MDHSQQAETPQNAGAAPPRRRRSGRLWRSFAVTGLVVMLVAGGAVYYVQQRDLRAQLVRADPETIPGDAKLRAFAISYARPVYAGNCAACHGDRMQGDPGYGVPNLTTGDWLYGEGHVSEIERTILFGIRASNGRTLNFADMPAFAQPVPYRRYQIDPLGPDDIGDVVMYLFKEGGRPADAAAAARGAKIFADRGQCFDCHSGDAKGDAAIGAPNLVDDTWLHGHGSFDDIYAVIAHGSAGVCPAPRVPAPERGRNSRACRAGTRGFAEEGRAIAIVGPGGWTSRMIP